MDALGGVGDTDEKDRSAFLYEE